MQIQAKYDTCFKKNSIFKYQEAGYCEHLHIIQITGIGDRKPTAEFSEICFFYLLWYLNIKPVAMYLKIQGRYRKTEVRER